MDQSTRTDSGTRADNNVNAITSAHACISYFSLRPGAPAPSSAKSRTTVYWLPLAIGVSPHQGHRTGTDGHGDERRIDDRHDTPLHGSNKCLQIPLFAASVQPSDGAPTRSCLPTPGCWAPLVQPMF
jgi:hypothetical protein